MDIRVLDTASPQWLETLAQMPHDVYQLPQYLELEAARNGAIPEAIVVIEGDQVLFVPYLLRQCQDVIPAALLSADVLDAISPYGYPGLLLSPAAKATPGFADRAMQALQQTLQSRGVCSLFLRLHPALNQDDVALFAPDTFTANGETVSIDLRLENLWAPTRSGHRSTINKCKRLGMVARIVPFLDYLDEFVRIYEETMDRVNATAGYYEFNTAYFRQMHELMGDRLHLCIVEYEGEIACAGLYTESCGIVQSALGGTRDRYVHLSPSSLETDYARDWAKARGNQFLHLGGGVGGSQSDSVYNFKAGFSKLRHPFYTLRLIVDPVNYQHLIDLRAKALNCTVESLAVSPFFPAYRATV
jgi:hypothetical protein